MYFSLSLTHRSPSSFPRGKEASDRRGVDEPRGLPTRKNQHRGLDEKKIKKKKFNRLGAVQMHLDRFGWSRNQIRWQRGRLWRVRNLSAVLQTVLSRADRRGCAVAFLEARGWKTWVRRRIMPHGLKQRGHQSACCTQGHRRESAVKLGNLSPSSALLDRRPSIWYSMVYSCSGEFPFRQPTNGLASVSDNAEPVALCRR